MFFRDRAGAGQKLSQALLKFKNQHPVILALPRGGVVTGAEVAKRLDAFLDLIIVRKIGHPYSPEYAVCAVTTNNHLVCNQEEIKNIDPLWLQEEVEKEHREAKRRQEVYLGNRQPISLENKTAIIVDDGIATGLTMETAIKEVKHRKAKQIIVAVPVIPKETANRLREKVDEVVALDEPEIFLGAVGAYYEYFPQVSDAEVIKLLSTLRVGRAIATD